MRSGRLRDEFRYPLFMVYLDLDELPALLRRAACCAPRAGPPLAWFRRADHLGDPRRAARRRGARARRGAHRHARPTGPIRLLTHLRCFGHCFNPVSFYYCYDAAGERVEAVVADVTNTPWGESHCLRAGRRRRRADHGSMR